jgi:hypothetical protein
MQQYVPEALCYADGGPTAGFTIFGEKGCVPVYLSGYSEKVKNPSLFVQRTNYEAVNDVVHAKLISHSKDFVRALDVYVNTGSTRYRAFNVGSVSDPGRNRIYSWEAYQEGTIVLHFWYQLEHNILKGYRVRSAMAYVYVERGKIFREETYTRVGILQFSFSDQGLGCVKTYPGVGHETWPEVPTDRYSDPVLYVTRDWFKDQESAAGSYFGQCSSALWTWAGRGLKEMLNHDKIRDYDYQRSNYPRRTREVAPIPNLVYSFILGEVGIYGEGLDPRMLGNGLLSGNYWRNWLIQHAYEDALAAVPSLSDNSLSNIAEFISVIYNLVVNHRLEIPKRLQDAWLQYRYVYNTTKLDLKDAFAFLKRHYDLEGFNRVIKCRGTSRTTYLNTPITCRCTFDITPAQLRGLESVWRDLYTYGLQPNAYVLWDMTPFSFIVDWFVPIGSLASVLDMEANMLRGQYAISNVCFSLQYQRVIDGYNINCYTRWAASPLQNLNGFYWFDRPKTSGRVVCYRILDTASLLIG